MYATCTFCYAALGANRVIEGLPVGRRLAFDPARGCVWVVCLGCERWNLVPLEERWEATEACERLYRATSLRYSSGNIGLAWLPDHTDLVRVGPALRPEVAAWRYGRRLAWRGEQPLGRQLVARARTLVVRTLRPGEGRERGLGARARTLVGQAMLGVMGDRVIDLMALPHAADGTDVPLAVIRYRHLAGARLVRPEPAQPWRLVVPHDDGEVALHGEQGITAAARMLAIINGTERGAGFAASLLEAATRKVDESAAPDSYFNRVLSLAVRSSWGRGDAGGEGRSVVAVEHAASETERLAWRLTGRTFWGHGGIGSDPATTLLDVPLVDRLALEMAAHEEQERRALDGELASLEAAWREAEEIATIADALLDP